MHPMIDIAGDLVPTYFLCSLIGFVVSLTASIPLLASRGMLRRHFGVLLCAVPGLVIGGRAFGVLSVVLTQVAEGTAPDVGGALASSGIVYWGGLLGYLGMLWAICRIRQLDFTRLSDVLAVCVPMFHAFGRIGCYCGGCCYGVASSLFSLPYRTAPGDVMVSRVPVQLIEAAFEGVLCLVLLRIYKARTRFDAKRPQHLLVWYLMVYAVFRFCVEFVRGDAVRGVYLGLSFSQYVCVTVLVVVSARSGRQVIAVYREKNLHQERKEACLQNVSLV